MKEAAVRTPTDGAEAGPAYRSRTPGSGAGTILGAARVTVPLTAAAILGLHQSAGNAATIAYLQRSVPAEPVIQRSPGKGALWDPLHLHDVDGLIPVTEHFQARNNLTVMALSLQSVAAEWHMPAVQRVLEKVERTKAAMPETGDLTPDEVSSLQALNTVALLAYQSGLKQMQDAMKDSLSKYQTPEELAVASERVAELLHQGFTGGDHSVLTQAKHASHYLHTAEENVHYLIEWAELGLKEVRMLDAEGIMAAKYFEHAHSTYSKIIHGTGKILPWLVAVHGALQAVWEAASAVSASRDSSASTVKKASAGIEAGTATVQAALGAAALVGVQAAGSLGLVWANLVVPQTQKALQALDLLDSAASRLARTSQADWWAESAQKGGSAPIIPKAFLAQNWFPGGQATLNYMWAVFQGNPPETAPATVTKFFYDNRKKMNEEEADGDKLETEWHLLRENEVKNLKEWVVAHRTMVWGMLYGSLPSP